MSSYQIQLQILDENGKSQKIYPINTSLDNIVGVIEPSLLLALPGEKEGETLATSLSYIKAYLKNLEDVASVKRSVSSSATLDDARTLATSKAVYTVQQALTTANSEIVNIKNNYAIKNHADTLKTYGIGTSLLYGHVKVSDTYDSQVSGGNAENGVSASQNALYRVYNALITKTNDIVDNFKEHVNTQASNETSGHVAIGDNITVSNGKISLGKENVCGALGYTPIQASDLTQGEGISISGTKITNSGVRSISEGSTNGTISTNINGTTKNIVVHGLKSAAYTDADDYADAIHYHDSIDQTNDHRTAATTPNDYNGKLKNAGLKESSVIGSPDASTFAGVIGYRGYANSNGGVANEFAFTSLGKLFRRTGATTTWNPWLEMIDSGNISKYAPSLSGSGASGNWNINAATATKFETARNIKIGETSKKIDGSTDISFSLNEIGCPSGWRYAGTTPAVSGWYRIAKSPINVTNCIGTFYITGKCPGYHSNIILNAGISHNNKPSIIQMLCSNYFNSATITKARIVYNSSTRINSYAYLEVFLNKDKAIDIVTTFIGTEWLGVGLTDGEIPEGYTSTEITFVEGNGYIVGNLYGNASTATKLGTSNVGNGAKPIYLNAGAATASSSTVGSADTPIYMNGGTLTSTGKKFSDYLPLTGGTITGVTTFNKGINLPNGLWNVCGDDAYFGDFNAAGCMAFKSTTSSLTGIALVGATSPNMYGRLLVANDGYDMYLATNRNFYISNGSNSARAAIYASAFIQQSSGRIKTNIVDLSEEEAKKVLDLRPVSYDYISEVEQKGCTGLIAEEVAEILPNTVIGNVDCSDNDIEEIKKIGIDYSKFVPYLIKLIQIQEKRIVELEKNLV